MMTESMDFLKTIDYNSQEIEEARFPLNLSADNYSKFTESSKLVPLMGIELEYDFDERHHKKEFEKRAIEASSVSNNLPLILKSDGSLDGFYNTELNTAPAPLYQTLKFVKALYKDPKFFSPSSFAHFIHSWTGAHIHFAVGSNGAKSWFASRSALGLFIMMANSDTINRDFTVENALHRDFEEYSSKTTKRFSFLAIESTKNPDIAECFRMCSGGIARVRCSTVEWRSPRTPYTYEEFIESFVVALLMINFSNKYYRYYVDTYGDSIHNDEIAAILDTQFLEYFSKRYPVYVEFFTNLNFENGD